MTPRAFALALVVSMCRWTAFALETEEDPRLAEWIDALASPEVDFRVRAGRELLATGREGIRALLDAAAGRNVIIAEEARRVLTAAGPEAVDIMREVGYDKPFDHRERLEEAMAAVARMGEPVLPRMLNTITTANPVGSRFGFAVGVLLRMRGPAVEPMIRLLRHPKPRVRYEAAVLLAHWGDTRAFGGLLAALKDDEASVRAYAADGLGSIGDHRAVEALLDQLNDPKGEPRRAAVAALGKMYEPRCLHPIARLARGDRDILVRETASNVLMLQSHDRVGIRVGKRYKPYALSPARQPAVEFGFALRFGLTGALLLGSGLWLSRGMTGRGSLRWPSMMWVVIVAGTSGFLWGRVVENIWGSIENLLLFAVVPSIAAAGLLGGKLFCRGQQRRLLIWLPTGMTIGCFYVGYGLGWLALWGYFGV